MLEAAFTFFQRGGPLMWPLLICSLTGLTVTFERLFAFWRYDSANFYFRNLQQELMELVSQGRFDAAHKAACEVAAPICRVFGEALSKREIDFAEALQMAAQLELDKLRRGLSLLDTAITVGPMFGILGTVTGTIKTFNVLGATGMDNPLGATAGIAEALITTVGGLVVAIVCLFPFNFFVSQIKRRTVELEQAAHRFDMAYKAGLSKLAGNDKVE